jgi:nitrite reductase/ring-hydroxylating ferredoxin subunit
MRRAWERARREASLAGFATVASLEDLEGKELAAFEIEGERIAVARASGVFHAFGDACPHRQCSLAEGVLDGTVVTCPCHGSQFDVRSGERLRGPAVRGVPSYPVRIEDGVVSIER